MAFIAGIKSWTYKVFDLLLGRTGIFVFVLGWFLVISGVMMLAWPKRARAKMAGMGFGQIKGVLLLAFLFVISAVFSLSARGGLLAAGAAVVGLALLYQKAKKASRQKISEFMQRVPLHVLRWFACGQIALGAVMLFVQKRFW
jgi:hypothetical protein